jgi:hypothetical protein
MPNPIERVVDTYLRAWTERDPALRQELLEACFAVDGRLVTRHRVIAGRAALAADMERFHTSFQVRSVRRLSAIDTGHTTFRVRGVVEFQDGKIAEGFDAGEIGADGKITVVLTFDGPLPDMAPVSAPLDRRQG